MSIIQETSQFYDAWNAKYNTAKKRGLLVGDVIERAKGAERTAVVGVCQHTKRRYVLVQLDCLVQRAVDPSYILVTHPCCRFGLKCYLNNQQFNGAIVKIRITKKNPNSAWCDVVEVES